MGWGEGMGGGDGGRDVLKGVGHRFVTPARSAALTALASILSSHRTRATATACLSLGSDLPGVSHPRDWYAISSALRIASRPSGGMYEAVAFESSSWYPARGGRQG